MTKRIRYELNPWQDDPPGDLRVIPDFLPSPQELAAAERRTKVTLELSDRALKFFKAQSANLKSPIR